MRRGKSAMNPRIIALLVLLSAFLGLGFEILHLRTQLETARRETAESKAWHQADLAGISAEAKDASERARAEEQRRAKSQLEIVNAAKNEAKISADYAARARVASGGLRDQVAALVAASRGGSAGHPDPAGGGSAAPSPVDLLADVLSRADQRAGELAEAADAAGIAGRACERAYDALTPPLK